MLLVKRDFCFVGGFKHVGLGLLSKAALRGCIVLVQVHVQNRNGCLMQLRAESGSSGDDVFSKLVVCSNITVKIYLKEKIVIVRMTPFGFSKNGNFVDCVEFREYVKCLRA